MNDSAIKSTIQSFVYEGEGILGGIEQSRKTQADALTYIAQESLKGFTYDALGEFAREAAEYIGLPDSGPKRAVKKYLRGQERQNLSAQKRNQDAQFEREYQGWVARIHSFLSAVSAVKPSLKERGNSAELLSKLAKNEQFAKVETRVRRTIAFLKFLGSHKIVYNSEIASLLHEQSVAKNKHAYDILEDLETSLRAFVERELSRTTGNWWKEKVPEDVRKNAEERKQRDEAKIGASMHPVNYIDYPDYVKIITRRDNWERVFKPFFKDREIISAKLREIEPIRNAIAHPRPLTKEQITKLKLYSDEIIGQMKK